MELPTSPSLILTLGLQSQCPPKPENQLQGNITMAVLPSRIFTSQLFRFFLRRWPHHYCQTPFVSFSIHPSKQPLPNLVQSPNHNHPVSSLVASPVPYPSQPPTTQPSSFPITQSGTWTKPFTDPWGWEKHTGEIEAEENPSAMQACPLVSIFLDKTPKSQKKVSSLIQMSYDCRH